MEVDPPDPGTEFDVHQSLVRQLVVPCVARHRAGSGDGTVTLAITAAQYIDGKIGIHVAVDQDRVMAVRIVSSRRTDASAVLEGRPFADSLRAVPLLFSVCGVAQASAAATACEQAGGRAVAAWERARRRILVAAEMVQEHAGRMLLDWPELFLGSAPQIEELVAVRRHVTGVMRALGGGIHPAGKVQTVDLVATSEQISWLDAALARGIFGVSPAQWLRIRDCRTLRAWWSRTTTVTARVLETVADGALADLGRSAVAMLPPGVTAALEIKLDADTAQTEPFSARPDWDGQACETGPLARQRWRSLVAELHRRHGNGLMTRLTARLTDLAALPRRMQRYLQVMRASGKVELPVQGGVTAGAAHCGTGVVETARGRLIHRVRLRAGVVERYRIVAPTEWNFHPDGPLVRGVMTLPAADKRELRRQVAMLVIALDPCVAHDVIVEPSGAEET